MGIPLESQAVPRSWGTNTQRKREAFEGFEPGRDVARRTYLIGPSIPSVEKGYELARLEVGEIKEELLQ